MTAARPRRDRTAERVWWAAFLALTGAIVLAIILGTTDLTLGAAVLALALVVLAILVDAPPPGSDRRPW